MVNNVTSIGQGDIETTLQILQNKKGTVPDAIPNEMLKNCGETIVQQRKILIREIPATRI